MSWFLVVARKSGSRYPTMPARISETFRKIDFKYALETATVIAVVFAILFAGFLESLMSFITALMLLSVGCCLLGGVTRKQWRQFLSMPPVWALLGFSVVVVFQMIFRLHESGVLRYTLLYLGFLLSSAWLFFAMQDEEKIDFFARVMSVMFVVLAVLGFLIFVLTYYQAANFPETAERVHSFTQWGFFQTLLSGAPIFLACLYWLVMKSGRGVSNRFKVLTAIGVAALVLCSAMVSYLIGGFSPFLAFLGFTTAAVLYAIRMAFGTQTALVFVGLAVAGIFVILYFWNMSIPDGEPLLNYYTRVDNQIGAVRESMWVCGIARSFADPLMLENSRGFMNSCTDLNVWKSHGFFFAVLRHMGFPGLLLVFSAIIPVLVFWLVNADRPYAWLVILSFGVCSALLPIEIHNFISPGDFYGNFVYPIVVVSAMVLAINKKLGRPFTVVKG